MAAIDDHLPHYDVREFHELVVPLPPEEAVARMLAQPVAGDGIVWALLRLRGLRKAPSIEAFFRRNDFGQLERTPTEFVAGLAGTPWKRGGGLRPFAEAGPGTVRMVFDVRAEPAAGGSRLSTETRVQAVDESARRAFRRYWLVVGPFSALIRRRWLRGVRKDAR